MIWITMFFIILLIWFAVPYMAKKLQIFRLRRLCRVKRAIVLTYDDGPGQEITHRLLDILKSYNAAATFFLIGRKISMPTEVVHRLLQAGHEIGSHSYQHLHAWKCSPFRVYHDIKQGIAVVRAIAPCRLFRAPYGKTTLATLLQVAVEGCTQSWWTIDSTDTSGTLMSVDVIINKVRIQNGGVILMHDMDRPGDPNREAYVLNLTHRLLEMSENERFRICTLGEILQA